MQPDTLTKIERSGSVVTVGNPTSSERDALALHYGALRAAGHALIADEVFEADGGGSTLRFIHYATCKECNRGQIHASPSQS